VTAPAKGQAPKGQSPKGQGPKTTPPGQSERVPSGTVVTTATVQEQLASKPQLRTKLIGLLPPGTDINLAAAGFRNFGQFVAAVHVSRNLGIPFDQLKARMTGPEPMSLGQAITQLKPGLNDIETEVRRAENEANEDLKIRKR
jgi:hypothetical protein